MEVSVQEAALTLGISDRRVRALIANGQIPARRAGPRLLLVDLDSAKLLRKGEHPAGRHLSKRSAWALLNLASGREPQGLSASELARARHRLEALDHARPGFLSSRAVEHRFRAHPGILARMVDDSDLVLSGVSAAGHHNADLIALGLVEAYVNADSLDHLRRRYALDDVNASQENVLLRVPSPWPFDEGVKFAPPAVVAIDLIDAGDDRSMRAGRELLRRVLAKLDQP